MELTKDVLELLRLYDSLNDEGKRYLLDYSKFISIEHPKNLIENDVLTHKREQKTKK